MRNYSLSEPEERIATAVVNAAYMVHKSLGPGLLESIYEVCFCHELAKKGLSVRRQVTLPIIYDGMRFGFLINFNVPLIKNGIKRYVL